MKTLIVICAYNEENNLHNLLRLLQPTSDKSVLVVDDGSTDNTRLVAEYNHVKVLSHDKREGKSFTVQHAINYALQHNYDVLLEIDADAQPLSGARDALIQALKQP